MADGLSKPVESIKAGEKPVEGAEALARRAPIKDYALLLKPRVMSLVVFTGWVGLYMAPGSIDFWTGLIAVLCIAVGAGASGAINMWYDRDIDERMERTINRPIPSGRMAPSHALWVGIPLAVLSVVVMTYFVNAMSGALLALTIAYYVFLYTMWLKRRTPQNIVIGGGSGAFPPVIGWAAVTGDVALGGVVLFMIIFMWTPPHFWALALFRCKDYADAGVPMLPVVAGEKETKKQILIYTVLLAPVVMMPTFIGMASWYYFGAAAVLSGLFIMHAIRVMQDYPKAPRKMFFFSLIHLFLVFLTLLLDRTAFLLFS